MNETPIRAGERTRRAILETAVDLASTEGLTGLSIGRLATALEMSKSGLFAHFGSKEELQLATVQAARDIFVREVVNPALQASRGLPRLEAFCDGWISYAEREVFRGGCFFAAASAEFDGRPGPVRDRIAEMMREWLSTLEVAVIKAQSEGHLNTSADPAQMAFELNALALAANWSHQLFRDTDSFKRAREGMRRVIAAAK